MLRVIGHARRVLVVTLVFLLGGVSGRARAAEDGAVSHRQVQIALLGSASAVGPVRGLIAELLAREGFHVFWAWPEQFADDQILSPPPPGPALVGVWIDLSSQVEARLYFRDASATRFVVRRLPVRPGQAAVFHEEVAQIVASAVLAIDTGDGRGLTPVEARAALQSMPVVHLGTSAAAPAAAPPREPLRWEARASITLHALASAVPVAGRIEAALGLVSGPWEAWLGGGYQPPRGVGGSIGVELQAAVLRAGVIREVTRTSGVALGVSAAIGLDRIQFRPRSHDPTVTLAAESHFWTPVARLGAEARFDRWRPFAIVAALVGDLFLADVHYDVRDTQGVTRRIVNPLRIQPGVSLAASYWF
jgi:hypothetical protein